MGADQVGAHPVIDVVLWKWKPAPNYRSKFEAIHVDVACRMIRRNYGGPLRITCITDDPEGITEADRIIPLWDEFSTIRSPHDLGQVARNPSCYRRLRMFAADAGEWLGQRIVSMDLDMVVTGRLEPIFDRPEPIVLWGDTNPRTHYNGSLIIHTAGQHAFLYDEFKKNPERCRTFATRAGQFGSDQAWISARLGGGKPKFGKEDGVYSYRNHINQPPLRGRLPENARVVMFHGIVDPWTPGLSRTLPWVAQNWK